MISMTASLKFASYKKNTAGWLVSASACLCVILSGCASDPASPSAAKQPFTGLWIAPESQAVSFELDLRQSGSHIEGYHAVLVLPGGRIEVALPTDGKPPSVQGDLLSSSVAKVSYQLRNGAGSGEATLTRRGNKMNWHLLSATGEQCLPVDCPLERQTVAPH
jgi:hypothetical protein